MKDIIAFSLWFVSCVLVIELTKHLYMTGHDFAAGLIVGILFWLSSPVSTFTKKGGSGDNEEKDNED